MKFTRQLRYYYLRLTRLRGNPHELALGIALGIFAGCMPILPVQTGVAIALAVLFRASKITAALGTWISNPLNWYFLYLYTYKIGAWILGLPRRSVIFSSIMNSIRNQEDGMVIAGKIIDAGGEMIGAFLIGGLILATVFSVPSYFVSLKLFRWVHAMRHERKAKRDAGARKAWTSS